MSKAVAFLNRPITVAIIGFFIAGFVSSFYTDYHSTAAAMTFSIIYTDLSIKRLKKEE